MRECPFHGCGEVIEPDKFACKKHWFSLSKEQQDEVHAAYREYCSDKIGMDELRKRQEAVLAAAQGEKPKPRPGVCSSCKARILWVKTAKGRDMPLDEAPNLEGTMTIIDGRAVTQSDNLFELEMLRYMPHWATCPHADQHRKKLKKGEV